MSTKSHCPVRIKFLVNNFSLAGKVVASNQGGRVSPLFVSVQYTASLESVDASAA